MKYFVKRILTLTMKTNVLTLYGKDSSTVVLPIDNAISRLAGKTPKCLKILKGDILPEADYYPISLTCRRYATSQADT